MRQFTTQIEQSGSKAFIRLSFDPNEAWGVKDRHHVNGTINGHAIRGPVTPDGDTYILSLGPAWRRDTGLSVGDAVEVALEAEGPQMDDLPADVTAALQKDPQARAFFESLATFYRKGYLRWIQGARKAETREARINELVRLLQSGKKQR